MKTLIIGTTITMLALGACATKPKPVEVVEQPAQTQPAPEVFQPAPVEPVEQVPNAPINVYNGPTPGTVADFKYSAGDDRVYFGFDRYDLTPQARETLRRQAEWLNRYPTAIVVIGGNADERGTREYNLALGARRAESTKAFLVSKGVNPGRITTVSYGKERPIDPGSNEAAWARNRNAHSAVMVGGNS
ncbi:MAG TPA: peptidoglycan-associated lipoprotein Pal [Hellea balneolensis]|uniref:Peptidoglycan-associated lipoprotein n=1 Tax=Hellea balneolensis TaxID=287478 RepID=A0A7C5R0E1_9PROT|nr:peptidoglycan-associated lipoprotein Pal [Hellea balneolensis]